MSLTSNSNLVLHNEGLPNEEQQNNTNILPAPNIHRPVPAQVHQPIAVLYSNSIHQGHWEDEAVLLKEINTLLTSNTQIQARKTYWFAVKNNTNRCFVVSAFVERTSARNKRKQLVVEECSLLRSGYQVFKMYISRHGPITLNIENNTVNFQAFAKKERTNQMCDSCSYVERWLTFHTQSNAQCCSATACDEHNDNRSVRTSRHHTFAKMSFTA